ncbi:uncharacterized protein LOC133152808 isoform X2 [Syngnathus typhle]|uniref:uncharacterized protein LOC133152808 isoform X2 n=1 Tax=Syngnathus typhle TaxID=161592 RepID=UPI002A69EE9F|nr:uncharacterized protein LOC133152808 isoform X2 [Syngnathus typhle]
MNPRIVLWMILTLFQQRCALSSNYTLSQWPAQLSSLRQGDPVHLLCSVLFDQKTDRCSGRHTMHWLRAGSRSGLVHVDGKTNEECDGLSPKRCIYRIFINVSESDGATYYCALEACGSLVFATGTKLDLHERVMPFDGSHKEILLVFSSIIALSLLVIALLINVIVKNNTACFSKQSKYPCDFQGPPTLNKEENARLNSTVVFSMVESNTLDAAQTKASLLTCTVRAKS